MKLTSKRFGMTSDQKKASSKLSALLSFISIFEEHNKELYEEYERKYTFSKNTFEDNLKDILQFFIEGGIDIDIKDKDGKTALIYEVESMGRTSTYQTKKIKMPL